MNGFSLAGIVSETRVGRQRLRERSQEFIAQRGVQFESLAHVGGVGVAVGRECIAVLRFGVGQFAERGVGIGGVGFGRRRDVYGN